VPGSPLDPRHRGTNQLLRDGATLVESAADVLAALGPLARAAQPRSPGVTARTRNRSAAPAEERIMPAQAALPIESEANGAADLIGRVCERLGPEPLLVDELIRQCQASTAEVQRALLELELDGRLERHPGNRVSLNVG
jgi:DNA processing protein